MTSRSRHEQIADLLRSRGECSVEFLAQQLGVCGMTVRRDLQAMANDGRVLRTHGGATRAERISFEFQFLGRSRQNHAAKEAIAAAAAQLVQPGQSVMLDSGTTTLALARQLNRRSQVLWNGQISGELDSTITGETPVSQSKKMTGKMPVPHKAGITGRVSVLHKAEMTGKISVLHNAKRVGTMLGPHQDLTVITTSLPIASELQFCEHIQVLLLGGALRRGAPDLEGALTEANLEILHADVAFIGADGIDRRGNIFNNSPAVGRMLGKMAAAADRVFVLADSSKIGRASLMRFGNIADWDGLITDRHLTKQLSGSLKRAGVRIISASSNLGRRK